MQNLRKGFTLIELLIVMAILGVLAVVVLIAINPVQQLARTRDTGRKSGVTQLGHALEAYYTARSGTYPAEGITWVDTLVTSGELSTVPSQIDYPATIPACGPATQNQNHWCMDLEAAGGTDGPAIVYARLESNVESSKCAVATDFPYFVYSTLDGRGGLVCSATDPVASATGITFNPVQ